MKVIGITGYAQNGKDSLGSMFEDIGFTKLAFADALRECVRTLDPVVEDRNILWRYSSLVDAVGYEEAKRNPEVRRLLQVMGTEVARNILGEQTWVNALDKRWTDLGMPNLVITDVRFPNEAEWVKARGTLVKVERPGFVSGISREHPSEANIANLPVDTVLSAFDMHGLEKQFLGLRAVLGV